MLRSRLRRWLISATATAASTYALEGIATAAGVVLLVSGALDDLPRDQLAVALAASYLLWAFGLRVSVGANWALLEATGTSTNLPSLMAYELVRLRTRSRRLQRLAVTIGYVGTEIAKEAPYYAAAFGIAAISDELTAHDATVFLIGCNLGAAAYEAALGVTVRLGLRRAARTLAATWLWPA
jgi:hypothetical protein